MTLSLSDENFAKLIAGKQKAQTLFMSGKLKVKGNVMKGKDSLTGPAWTWFADKVYSDEDGADPRKGWCCCEGQVIVQETVDLIYVFD